MLKKIIFMAPTIGIIVGIVIGVLGTILFITPFTETTGLLCSLFENENSSHTFTCIIYWPLALFLNAIFSAIIGFVLGYILKKNRAGQS